MVGKDASCDHGVYSGLSQWEPKWVLRTMVCSAGINNGGENENGSNGRDERETAESEVVDCQLELLVCY